MRARMGGFDYDDGGTLSGGDFGGAFFMLLIGFLIYKGTDAWFKKLDAKELHDRIEKRRRESASKKK